MIDERAEAVDRLVVFCGLEGRLGKGVVGAPRRSYRIAGGLGLLVLVGEGRRAPGLHHVPLQIVGEHAQKDMRTDAVFGQAPRGTTDAPAAFDTLLPYVTLSDLVSTEILSGLVIDSGRDQAVIMVIQGAGMGHIPGEGWNNLKSWQTNSNVDPTTIRIVEAGDFDGDGADELVLVVQADGQHPDRILVFDFEDHTWSGNRLLDVPVELDLSSPIRSAVGDFDGNGAADLAIFVDQPSDRQDVWILKGGLPAWGHRACPCGAPRMTSWSW